MTCRLSFLISFCLITIHIVSLGPFLLLTPSLPSSSKQTNSISILFHLFNTLKRYLAHRSLVAFSLLHIIVAPSGITESKLNPGRLRPKCVFTVSRIFENRSRFSILAASSLVLSRRWFSSTLTRGVLRQAVQVQNSFLIDR